MSTNFGINLRKFREINGYSQDELANLLTNETGTVFTQKHISNYEATPSHPKVQYLPVIAKLLNVTIDQLFGFEIEPPDIDISEAIGMTRPELNNLSKSELKQVLEKYLSYMDEIVKTRDWAIQKLRRCEAYNQKLKEKFNNVKPELSRKLEKD